jgi:hypothetical protein
MFRLSFRTVDVLRAFRHLSPVARKAKARGKIGDYASKWIPPPIAVTDDLCEMGSVSRLPVTRSQSGNNQSSSCSQLGFRLQARARQPSWCRIPLAVAIKASSLKRTMKAASEIT